MKTSTLVFAIIGIAIIGGAIYYFTTKKEGVGRAGISGPLRVKPS